MLALLVILPLIIERQYDTDIWFILNGGRYVLQNGIPYTEPFTMHTGFAFVMQQWLSSVIYWLAYSGLGEAGLMLIMYLTSLLIIFVMYRLCMLVTGGRFLAAYGLTFLSCSLLSIFMVTRPQIFSILLLLTELYFLEKWVLTNKPAYLCALPLISILLVNFHASMWLMLYVFMLPYFVDSFRFKLLFVRGQGYRKLPLVICAVIMALTGLINPYGISAETYLFRSYGSSIVSNYVIEMLPPDINTLTGLLIFGVIFIVFAIYALCRKNTIRLRYVLLTLGTAFMAVSSRRSFQLFIIASAFGLAYLIQNAVPTPLPSSKQSSPRMRRILCVLICIALAGAGCISFTADCWDEPDTKKAVDHLLSGNDASDIVLYNGYNDGAYSEFRGIKTYIDARAEVFLEKNNGVFDVMDEYYGMQEGHVYYKDVLDKYGFTHVLAIRSDILWEYLMHDSDFSLCYEDEHCRVFEAVGETGK